MTEIYNEKYIKIRKPHVCEVCLRKLPKGYECHNHHGKTEDGFFNYYTCNTCYEILCHYSDICIDISDGYIDNSLFEEHMTENKCSTPLQLLNKLKRNEAVIL